MLPVNHDKRKAVYWERQIFTEKRFHYPIFHTIFVNSVSFCNIQAIIIDVGDSVLKDVFIRIVQQQFHLLPERCNKIWRFKQELFVVNYS